ncbi:hypothetical protein E3Q23_03038 [Wallemia mellicola]|uniref:ANTH-domain-containing protein n=1 Tax=Wallemia mellicola TaxID=1708541 RepID=A0A4T0PGB8_9BASI|nr:hypothetical protein E3Q23_03038 [Wallemia mellicola]TIC09696.1 ANTH-domain-containing protein [Wallemia mellicola]TIC10078.1 ANTH-domain-containing protein [Wallemia mellicola]TIC63504.1 ANTH-domain-containing protein [Wallemia mellicola]
MSRVRQRGYDFETQPEETYGFHQPSRPVDRDKAEAELALNIKKATNTDETAPKQKHVRIYTWDYHSSQSIWSGLRVQPVMSDEVQTYKALIVVHKIIQEGHPITLKEVQQHVNWLDTCSRTVGNFGLGYAPLIQAYVQFIMSKLRFHRHHQEFNGLFEYAEYITLKGVDDPNEGYETVADLMNLQDGIDSFQRLVFMHLRGISNNECRISSLVPLVKESYGIYRFITSMLRAMHRRVDNADEVLQPLVQRYNGQHHQLRKFYYECSNLKYLTSLINVPKLGQDPPNLWQDPEGHAAMAERKAAQKSPAPPPAAPATPSVDIAEQARMLKEYEDQQAKLQAERDAQEAQRQAMMVQQQREFEEQQMLQQQQQEMARQQLLQQQAAQQHMGVAAEMERQLLEMRGQFERDQIMLQQYDQRVKALETELAAINANVGAQMIGKDELIKSLQDQITMWRNKYEALAKLYSQLRTEHLDMLGKFKQMQLKANSAQEAITKYEKMERDVKAKNLELADMIRERDRARFDLDRLKSSQKDELSRLRRDLDFANERAEDATRHRSTETSSMISRYNRQLNELEDSLHVKQTQIDELLHKLDIANGEADRVREEKDQEIAIIQEGMDSTINKLGEMQLTQGESDQALNAQIDLLIVDHDKKLKQIIDSILQACVHKIDDVNYELESSIQTGNQNATPEYTLSMIEKAQSVASEFAVTFTSFIAPKQTAGHVDVIKIANDLSQTICEILLNAKGVSRLAKDDEASDALIKGARKVGDVAARVFLDVQSFRLALVPSEQRALVVARKNSDCRESLNELSDILDSAIPKGRTELSKANGEIGDIVEKEMLAAANAIQAATERIQAMMQADISSRYSGLDKNLHDSILEASLAITNAIARLIQAATESQKEIVAQGRGSTMSAQQFYKRNNRWTEGLISAAKAVAFATNLLIEAADGVLNGSHSLEQLIVASNEVAAATAQLVAASRVKANFMSKTQERLEIAAKAVTEACKALVRQVKAISAKQAQDADANIDWAQVPTHEFKVREMEQQVEILKLEKDLSSARRTLGAMRRAGYRNEDDDTN